MVWDISTSSNDVINVLILFVLMIACASFSKVLAFWQAAVENKNFFPQIFLAWMNKG